jgi:hypothetical protein
MKKNYSFYSLLTAIPVALLVLVGFTSGQGGNYSGSPGDNNATCTACHSAGANHGGSVSLNGVPSTYVDGTAYPLTLSINGSSVSKFGFNITAEDQNGNKVGTWATGSGSQFRNGGSSVGLTHSNANTNSWSFSWTAPADVGPISFHYSTIQANGAGGNSGDQTLSGSTGQILTTRDAVQTTLFDIYPTIVNQELQIELGNASQAIAGIYNLSGQLVKNITIEGTQERIDVSDVASGVYLIQVSTGGLQQTQRFIKK